MEMELRIRGVAKRWFLHVFLIVACVIIALVVVFCVFFSQYYRESARSLAAEYAQDFSVLSSAPADRFAQLSREYTENFIYKNKIEIQVLDNTGKIISTTSGFEPQKDVQMPDYAEAASSADGIGLFFGKSDSGEKIMAETALLKDDGSGSNGAIRWIISAEKIEHHIMLIEFVAVGLGFLILLLFLFSGLYFLSTILNPLRNVSAAARRIAMGDFNATLNVEGKNEISELCDTINYMASELKQAETIKNDFISSVSHELRTPLTAIRGWGETAKMSIGTDDELVEKGIDVVLSESERLSGLVEELLDFSRMQTGRLKVEMSPLYASDALSAAVDMYVELARQQRIELLLLKMENEPLVMGDMNRLKQVFINIIDNAVKYTGDGGQIIVQMQAEEGCITITISDTGAGIPAQDIDHVKEKFFKSKNSVRGSGIGLAVADEIMKQHNGLLFLESVEGIGTTVTAVLPVMDHKTAPKTTTHITLDKAAEEATAQVVADAYQAAETTLLSNETNPDEPESTESEI